MIQKKYGMADETPFLRKRDQGFYCLFLLVKLGFFLHPRNRYAIKLSMSSSNPTSPSRAGTNMDSEIDEIVQAGRSILPPEVWDYIIAESLRAIDQSDVVYSVIHTSTDCIGEKPCLPTQSY